MTDVNGMTLNAYDVLVIFFCSVIRRLVILISVHATVMADCEANKRQAQSATDAARRLLEDKENKTNKVNFYKYILLSLPNHISFVLY